MRYVIWQGIQKPIFQIKSSHGNTFPAGMTKHN